MNPTVRQTGAIFCRRRHGLKHRLVGLATIGVWLAFFATPWVAQLNPLPKNPASYQ